MTPAPTDRIELTGLRLLARCGVLPEEIERPQPFEVDVVVELDLRAAGASDSLADTVDYGALVERIVATAGGHRNLMERLAGDIAHEVLAAAPATAAVVTVRKLRPPVPHDLATAGVTIRRTAR